MKTSYAKLRGPLYWGGRNRTADTDGDMVTAVRPGQVEMGNIEGFSISLTEEVEQITETHTGSDNIDFVMPGIPSGTADMTLFSFNQDVLAAMLHGTPRIIKKGTLTAAPLLQRWRAWGPNAPFAGAPTTRLPYEQVIGQTAVQYYAHAETRNGLLHPARNLDTSSIVIVDSTPTTPKTLVQGVNYVVFSESGQILFYNLTTGGPYQYPLKVTASYGAFTQVLDNPVWPSHQYQLEHQNISDVVVKDSAPTPVTVNAAYYDVDRGYGTLTFKPETFWGAFNGANYVQPLRVTAAVGPTRSLPMLTNRGWEYAITGNLTNIVNGSKWKLEFYRARPKLPNNLDIFSANTLRLPIQFELLADTSMPSGGPLGQVGRLVEILDMGNE